MKQLSTLFQLILPFNLMLITAFLYSLLHSKFYIFYLPLSLATYKTGDFFKSFRPRNLIENLLHKCYEIKGFNKD